MRPTDGRRPFPREALPRPGADAGAYLFGLDGHLYSHSQGADGAVRRWDAEARRWVDGTDSHSARVRVGKGLLALLPGRVQCEGQESLAPPGRGSYRSFWYSL